MGKTAVLILAAGDAPESLGRVVNALMSAAEFAESGGEVRIVFDGAGTIAAAAFAAEGHKYHQLFTRVRAKVAGVCSYCAGAYQVKDKIQAAGLPLAADFREHPSLKRLIDEGFQILTF